MLNNLLFGFPPAKDPKRLNPLVLAYMGDAVYEVFIRQFVISQPNHRPNHIHRQSTQYVSAKAQARSLQRWSPHLTEEELDIVKRGGTLNPGRPPRMRMSLNIGTVRLLRA
ncbi:hypothetical protein LJK88_48135 [Paenibacillus sp. P26]|nr:hypothetical protein LJK88_48135 [Paenibacillus sp. P26]